MRGSKATGIIGVIAVILMYLVPYTVFAHEVRDLSLYFYWLGLAIAFTAYAVFSLEKILKG